ncbi:ABC transporter substrate-binding protein [Pseudonocardia hispaniensis]|uniref:ABC transporter substrate-binding protein n=1 Tax=Pseudonocardia hispaniensis TaxID=904933 RepID=A0ABW1J920_9PSEU
MFRKSVAALAAGALFTLAACGGPTGGTTTAEDGVKMGLGVTAEEIRVGLLTDYSGPIAEAATSGSLGSEVLFSKINDEGGICGRKIVVDKQDTKYDPQVTTQVYRAVSRKVVMLTQIIGTASIVAVKDSIARDSMPTITASLNTTTLREKDIYVPLPVFEIELANGVVWAAQQAGASADHPLKLALVTSADAYGEVYADATVSAATQTPGVEVVANPTFTATDTDFTAQVAALKKSGADVVMLGVTPAQVAGLVGQSAQLGYTPTWISTSGSWNSALAEPLAGLLDTFYVSGGYGTLDDDVHGIRELKDAMATYAPEATLHNFNVGGWLTGTATVAALTKACENKDLTREGVSEAMRDLEVDYQGITPPVNLGNGGTIVSYFSRINTVGPGGVLTPVTDFMATDAAKAWGQAQGL